MLPEYFGWKGKMRAEQLDVRRAKKYSVKCRFVISR
jgi:hypothetical protein